VCKDPQKTRKRKATLVSEDIINTQQIQLTQGIREEEEESPIAEIPGQAYPGFQSAAKAIQEPIEDRRSASPLPLLSLPAHTMKRSRDEFDDPVTGPSRPLKVFKTETHTPVARSRPVFKVPSAAGLRTGDSCTLTGAGVKERAVFYGNVAKREPKPRVEEPDADLELDEKGLTTQPCTKLCRSRELPSLRATLPKHECSNAGRYAF
jgi:hypothetical protein